MKFLIMFFIFNILSCSQETYLVYETSKYIISYPSDLKFDKQPQNGVEFIALTNKLNEDDNFVENINLVTREAPNLAFDDFVKITINEISNFANIIENRIFNNNGQKCLEIIFTANQNNTKLKVLQHFYLKNQGAYVLTFTSELKEYDKYFNDMNETMMSFTLK